ncbi:MAG: GTP pyrophosphokinase [Myxococcales bacterium]|nr:MAG: GTP pyrophosphokinase [Myxococcales bacterium]
MLIDGDDSPFDEAQRAAVRAYAAAHADLEVAGAAWVETLTELLNESGINYLSVTGRTKSVTSYAAKVTRLRDGQLVYPDPAQITDQLGARVITYLRSDVNAVAELLAEEYDVLEDRDLGEETASEGRFGYASRHLLLGSGDRHPISVQVRTVLQHAWAEFEHDIRYKGTVPTEFGPDLDRRFTLAAGLLELADREFSEIRDRLQQGMERRSLSGANTIDPQELAAWLAGRYPEAGWSRTDHYEWIADLAMGLGITSLDELESALATVDSEAITERMGYKYPPGAVRRLDDALLSTYGEDYVALERNAHRVGLLRQRLTKLR